METPLTLPDGDYWDRIARARVLANDDLPVNWRFVFDDGADGCMPTGWYAIGLSANGFPIDWPTRHEYGPYASIEEARAWAEHAEFETL